MTKFKVIFCKKDGLEDSAIGNSYQLSADTLEDAEIEAMNLPKPDGANFFKILDEGQVVLTHGFAL